MENINGTKNMALWEEPAGNGPRPLAEDGVQSPEAAEFSMAWVMARMDVIIQNTAYINETLATIRDIAVNGQHDYAAQGKANALGKVVSAREETNRQTLRLLEKMYDALNPAAVQRQQPSIHEIQGLGIDFNELLHDMDSEDKVQLLRDMCGLR